MSLLSTKHLKYPLSLFGLLLIAKLVYIIVESGYNYDVLSITTSSEISRKAIEALNDRGHLIAATGFTLLCVPIFYYFVKQRKRLIMWLLLSVFSLISFSLFYLSLNILVDKVVEKNQDQRYAAYYTNLLKYGIIDGIIYYESFISKARLGKLNVNDKILLTNIFLLAVSDAGLINKFRQKGEKNTIELYLQKYKEDDYQQKFSKFKKMYSKVEDKWIEFNHERKKLAEQLQKLGNKKTIKNSFDKMDKQLSANYEKYHKAYKNLNNLVAQKTSLKDLREFKKSLDKYFKYQKHKKAQVKYREKMTENFGHYVEPKVWKNKNGEVTYSSITRAIKQQIEQKIKSKAFNLPSGLSKKEFLNSKNVKIEVAKKLKENEILIPADFDYSFEQFQKYYNAMSNKKYTKVYTKFYQELKKKIGKNDLKLDDTWQDFIYSDYLYNQILNRVGSSNKSDVKLYQAIFMSKNISDFNTLIYKPKALVFATENIIHKKNQFKNDTQIAKKGDQAIKLLYIPPIALSLSILALLMNIFTVVGMLLQLFLFRAPLISAFIKVILILAIVAIPLMFKADNLQNTMLSKTTNPTLLNALQWSSYWERVNYVLHSG